MLVSFAYLWFSVVWYYKAVRNLRITGKNFVSHTGWRIISVLNLKKNAQKKYKVIFSDDLFNNNVLPSVETKNIILLNVLSFGADHGPQTFRISIHCGPFAILGCFFLRFLHTQLQTLNASVSILADPLLISLPVPPKSRSRGRLDREIPALLKQMKSGTLAKHLPLVFFHAVGRRPVLLKDPVFIFVVAGDP